MRSNLNLVPCCSAQQQEFPRLRSFTAIRLQPVQVDSAGQFSPALVPAVPDLRVETRGETVKPDEPEQDSAECDVDPSLVIDTVTVHFDVLEDDGTRGLKASQTPVYRRDNLGPGTRVAGPALAGRHGGYPAGLPGPAVFCF